MISDVATCINCRTLLELSMDLVSLAFPSSSMYWGTGREALGLHYVMFLPTLYTQCDSEQFNKWVPLAQSCTVLGTYAQTEMGHGQLSGSLQVLTTTHYTFPVNFPPQ